MRVSNTGPLVLLSIFLEAMSIRTYTGLDEVLSSITIS